MHAMIFAAVLVFLSGPAAAQTWTVLEPDGGAGAGRAVREQAAPEDAQAASAAAKAQRLEAADGTIPRPAGAPGGPERNWTVLDAVSPDGRSRVVRERATLQEAQDASYDAVGGGKGPSDAAVAQAQGPASPGAPEETWTVLEPEGLDGRGRAVQERETLQQAETQAHDALIREEASSSAAIPTPSAPGYAAGKPETWTVLGAPGQDGASRAVRETQTYEGAEAASGLQAPPGYRVIRRSDAQGSVVVAPGNEPPPPQP